MSVEQVARDFITGMMDINKVKALLTTDAVASGGVLPQPMLALQAFSTMEALNAGFSDLKVEVQQVTVNGNQATVKAQVSGTNTGPLSLPIPGMPSIPPTGKKVSVKDAYVVTVQGEQVSHLSVASPADGGVPAMLAQLGVKLPGM